MLLNLHQHTEGSNDFTINSQDFRFKRSIVEDLFEFSGEGQLCFTVTIVDDILLEFEESFSIQLDSSGFLPVGVVVGSQDTTQINITDDQGKYSLETPEQVHV